jgi:hypothetical protein
MLTPFDAPIQPSPWRRTFAQASLVAILGAPLLWPAQVWAAPRQSDTSAPAQTLEGQRFDGSVKLADRALRLNGLGLRGVAWVKAFVAGLYLSAPTRDAGQAVSMPGPKRMRLKIMLNAPSHELTKSLTGRIEDHEPQAVREQLGERLGALASLIDSIGDLQPGDTVDLDFVPDKGTHLRLNDKLVGQAVPGDDLYRAVLQIFLGEHPVDKRLKQGLLRGGV